MKKIIVFGKGELAERVVSEVQEDDKSEIVAIFANDAENGDEIHGVPVNLPPIELSDDKIQYDLIVLSLHDWYTKGILTFDATLRQLYKMGVPANKIEIAKRYSRRDPRVNFVENFSKQVCENGVKGSVAECGVYRGHFSHYISEFFPDSKLYLFDSFEGFNESDVDIERQVNTEVFESWWNGSSTEYKHIIKFEKGNASVAKMRAVNRENVIIKRGYIPDTFAGLEKERFIFVSLDTDLYLPQLEGLRFFFDRMVDGGIILVHDYYFPVFSAGVKKAVDDFALEREFLRIPIGDSCSIAIVPFPRIVKDLRQDIANLRQDAANLRQDKANLKQETANLRQDKANLKQHITDIESSTSWKVTAPMRATMEFLRKVVGI